MDRRSEFPLFQTPIDLSHAYWKKIVHSGDMVIDATCGNGHDTCFLATSLDNQPLEVIAIDIQAKAIENTKIRLKTFSRGKTQVTFYQQCHSTFPSEIKVQSVKLIVYNLGYLPCGDKTVTTMMTTTLQSLSMALPLIALGGAISITCYPGHPEGKNEEDAILAFCSKLPSNTWSSCHHQWINRFKAPSLIILQKVQNFAIT